MGKSILYKDVVIRIDRYDGENVVEILNCEYRDRVLYSARFSLQENSEICVSYFVSDERISIACIARKVLFWETQLFLSLNISLMLFSFMYPQMTLKKLLKNYNVPLL